MIFMIFALYNGSPIFNGDTTTYLNSGMDLWVPADRPIFYGLFIRVASMGASAWSVIFMQCVIMAYVSIRFIKVLLPSITKTHLLALLLIISLGTIASWNTGQLLPDAFTPILFLSIYLYLQAKNTLAQKLILLGIIYLSTVVHYSHYVIATCFTVATIGLSFIFRSHFQHLRTKALHLIGVVVLAWVSLFSSNYVAGYGFTSSRSSHVFLMGKLCENGILKKYLDKNCATNNYELCKQKEVLPPVAWEFVWAEGSPMYNNDIWESSKQEYKGIIKDILTSPEYWPQLVYRSLDATFRQVILMNIDEGEENSSLKFEGGHALYEAVRHHFPREVNQFKASRQNSRMLEFSFYDHVYVVVFLLTSLLLLFLVNDKYKRAAITIYSLVVLFVFVNAFATAAFGNVLTRLNSRAIWLIPMTNIIFIYLYAKDRIERMKQA